MPEPKRKAIEAALRKWQEKYAEAADSLADADEQHDARSVATKVSNERLTTRAFKLLSYFDELISQFDKTGNVGNRRVYHDVQNALRRFVDTGARRII